MSAPRAASLEDPLLHNADQRIESGLLYYTQTNSVIRVQAARNELRGLLIARNEMARYLTHPMPPFTARNEMEHSPLPPSHPLASAPSGQSIVPDHTGQLKLDEIEEDEQIPDIKSVAINIEIDNGAGDVMKEEEDLWGELDLFDPSDLTSQPKAPLRTTRPPLPPAIDDERTCKKCYAADGCMLYRRAFDRVISLHDDADNAMQQAYADRTSHLTEGQCDFFEKWERLISLEEREMVRFKKEIWTMTAGERQKFGKCLANMAVDASYEQPNSAKKAKTTHHRYTYRMIRSTIPPRPSSQGSSFGVQATQGGLATSAQSLLSGHIGIGDSVVVSVEPSVLALARGFVLELQADFIVVGLDHLITSLPGDSSGSGRDRSPLSSKQRTDGMVYRIDKDELQAGMGKIRDNLARLFYVQGDEKRRRLVVDLEKPTFDGSQCLSATESSSQLNADQLAAVNKVLAAQDYALILGMPGTGKTTTIAEIIKALVHRGKSILLTSYTHSAVDNILTKITDLDAKILRLGNADKVRSHP